MWLSRMKTLLLVMHENVSIAVKVSIVTGMSCSSLWDIVAPSRPEARSAANLVGRWTVRTRVAALWIHGLLFH